MKPVENKSIESVTIVGAGKMGLGIAAEFAAFGYSVALQDPFEEALAHTPAGIREYFDLMVETELITPADAGEAMGRVRTVKDLSDAVKDAGHVVEAAPEVLTLKQQLFARLDELCGPEVTLATNSSTMKAEDCAAKAMHHPERILITHYWHPAPFIPLVEVIGGKKTDPGALERVAGLLRGLRKKVVLQNLELSTGPAGWGNALQHPIEDVVRKFVDEKGCDPRIIDDLIRFGFGRRLGLGGVFLRYDMVGLDFFCNAAKARGAEAWTHFSERVERGERGMKSGKGFYDWPGDSSKEFIRRYNLELIDMMKKDMERGDI